MLCGASCCIHTLINHQHVGLMLCNFISVHKNEPRYRKISWLQGQSNIYNGQLNKICDNGFYWCDFFNYGGHNFFQNVNQNDIVNNEQASIGSREV